MNDLVLCASCARHVRRTEERCPFCAAPVPGSTRTASPLVAPAGLSRAKLYAFHAAVATSVAATACGGATTTLGGADGAADVKAGDGQSMADAATDGAAADTGGQDGTTESSVTADAGADRSITDAAADRDGWGPPPPPYGCVFPEGCGDVKV